MARVASFGNDEVKGDNRNGIGEIRSIGQPRTLQGIDNRMPRIAGPTGPVISTNGKRIGSWEHIGRQVGAGEHLHVVEHSVGNGAECRRQCTGRRIGHDRDRGRK